MVRTLQRKQLSYATSCPLVSTTGYSDDCERNGGLCLDEECSNGMTGYTWKKFAFDYKLVSGKNCTAICYSKIERLSANVCWQLSSGLA